jgi:ribonuclease Z
MTARLVFLGTGSGKPMPHRNVSSVGLFWHGELFLFDCGEATQIQISRSNLKPGPLEGIFLSHLHGDHVNGLPGFLGSLTLDRRSRPLEIIGPEGTEEWIDCLLDLRILWEGFTFNIREIEEPGPVLEKQDYSIEAGPLQHRGVSTWGYAFIEEDRPGRFDIERAKQLGIPEGPLYGRLQDGETIELDSGETVEPDQVLGPPKPGRKIVYCSDTVPCDGAVELAKGADVLIHEGTYPAGREKKAHNRGHSTVKDAAECAKKADVEKLIITHISQKYTDLESFVEPARELFPSTQIASDFTEIEIPAKSAPET